MVDIPLNYIGFLQPTFCNGVKIGYVYVGARGIASACQKVEVSVSRETRASRAGHTIHNRARDLQCKLFFLISSLSLTLFSYSSNDVKFSPGRFGTCSAHTCRDLLRPHLLCPHLLCPHLICPHLRPLGVTPRADWLLRFRRRARPHESSAAEGTCSKTRSSSVHSRCCAASNSI